MQSELDFICYQVLGHPLKEKVKTCLENIVKVHYIKIYISLN